VVGGEFALLAPAAGFTYEYIGCAGPAFRRPDHGDIALGVAGQRDRCAKTSPGLAVARSKLGLLGPARCAAECIHRTLVILAGDCRLAAADQYGVAGDRHRCAKFVVGLTVARGELERPHPGTT